jgi:hypothetical protein
MKAYKIWHDTKHFIHKDTTNDMNVQWTTNIEDAKEVSNYAEAVRFFFDLLGFSMNPSKYDPLYLN